MFVLGISEPSFSLDLSRRNLKEMGFFRSGLKEIPSLLSYLGH